MSEKLHAGSEASLRSRDIEKAPALNSWVNPGIWRNKTCSNSGRSVDFKRNGLRHRKGCIGLHRHLYEHVALVEDALKRWCVLQSPLRRNAAPLLADHSLLQIQLLLAGPFIRLTRSQSTLCGLERLFGDVMVLVKQCLQARVFLTSDVQLDA